MFEPEILSFLAGIAVIVQLAGVALAAHAVMTIKRAQSAIAWSLALIGLPFAAIPLYLLFGAGHFHSYISARMETNRQIDEAPSRQSLKKLRPDFVRFAPYQREVLETLEKLNGTPFTDGNDVRLLVDGEETFRRMFEEIGKAENYILVQFFIVRDDLLSNRFKESLIRKAREGVAVYFLYDELGCVRLRGRYLDALEEAGIKVCSFNAARGPDNILHMNFRNHRKTFVVDGRIAFIGGHNLGDEYLGKNPRYSPWRDTHIEVTGPAVQAVQLAFVEDWYWAASAIPELNWSLDKTPGDSKKVMVAPTGPGDRIGKAVLLFIEIIRAARKRLWIVSPYFVPERAIMKALQAAAIRGVDVRIMVPDRPDHFLVWLAAHTFFEEAQKAGVRFYSYRQGFLHQKVALIDDYLSAAGTANLDNRSLSLNFEMTLLVADRSFASSMEGMLEEDFGRCELLDTDIFNRKPLWFRFAARLARLFSPLL